MAISFSRIGDRLAGFFITANSPANNAETVLLQAYTPVDSSGNPIGGSGANAGQVQGTAAAAAAPVGNPVLNGGSDGAVVRTFATNTSGSQIQTPYAAETNDWSYAAAAAGISNTTVAVTIKTAAGAGLKNYITAFDYATDTALGAATEIVIRKGAGGTVIWRSKISTAGQIQGRTIIFPTPISSDAAQLLEFATLTASVSGALYVNFTGYVGA